MPCCRSSRNLEPVKRSHEASGREAPRIGIDLGGTKIEIAALDATGAWVLRRRIPTPPGTYTGILDAIADLVADAERKLGPRANVGVGTPGSLSPRDGRIRNANSTLLNGKPLASDLAARLEREVRLANDADCFTLSEGTDGAAAGASIAFGVILGTGVGGGIAVEGKLLRGPNAIAGEWGHNPLPWPNADERPGPPCYCGKFGCIETFVSGPGLEREYAASSERRTDAREIVARAAAGEELARACLERYAERLARALASAINLLDPDAIVLGGGLSNADVLYELVPRLLPRYVFSDVVSTPLRRAAHGDSSGVRGAAWLWPAAPRISRAQKLGATTDSDRSD